MVVMMAGIHISQEIFAIDVLRTLKSSLEQRRKHVLRLLQLYGDQAIMFATLMTDQFNSISISRKVDGIGLSMDADLAMYS